jgi:hypothetical protein
MMGDPERGFASRTFSGTGRRPIYASSKGAGAVSLGNGQRTLYVRWRILPRNGGGATAEGEDAMRRQAAP